MSLRLHGDDMSSVGDKLVVGKLAPFVGEGSLVALSSIKFIGVPAYKKTVKIEDSEHCLLLVRSARNTKR